MMKLGEKNMVPSVKQTPYFPCNGVDSQLKPVHIIVIYIHACLCNIYVMFMLNVTIYVVYITLGCPSSECHYLPANLSPHVVCDVSQYGGTPPCYGEWSSIKNCRCDEDGLKLSETGRTYWCQGGSWDSNPYNVKCTGKERKSQEQHLVNIMFDWVNTCPAKM